MFKSARVKLTLFYLAILLAFSFTATIGFRLLFENEYNRSNDVERSGVRQLFLRGFYLPGPRPYSDFTNLQQDQAGIVRQRLNRDLILVNIAALAIGGALSYWFAGRTLKPIEEAHMAQARFATDASHELRTPLTNLRLENEIFLRQKHFSEAEARELIHSNLEEVQRMEGLSSNLLALTQYGHTPLRLVGVPVARIVSGAIKQKQKAAKDKGVAFITDMAAAKIMGHRDSLEQAMGILLDNAIKYGPEKGVVTIGGKSDDGYYLLWVQDEGPGIAAHDLPHIFDRLYRGDKARTSKTGGYGLGLSLARIIAKANESELKVQNVPDGGACFILRIPQVK
ncbi:MAG TPA: HAMP domain-containing sensor histidine kinase [Patescibacteria group bacterium]|nr:HAMP domain-containing sensor histidine kinase [Patescibacteria group bacterium]